MDKNEIVDIIFSVNSEKAIKYFFNTKKLKASKDDISDVKLSTYQLIKQKHLTQINKTYINHVLKFKSFERIRRNITINNKYNKSVDVENLNFIQTFKTDENNYNTDYINQLFRLLQFKINNLNKDLIINYLLSHPIQTKTVKRKIIEYFNHPNNILIFNQIIKDFNTINIKVNQKIRSNNKDE